MRTLFFPYLRRLTLLLFFCNLSFSWATELPVLLGIYPYPGDNFTYSHLGDELRAIEAWLDSKGVNKGVSIAGTFSSIEGANPEFNIPYELDVYWSSGAVPFVNLMTSNSMAAIASGSADFQIRRWADALKMWLDRGDNRHVFVAPFPEMNGGWVPYGLDAVNFKTAFMRLQKIFEDLGIRNSLVSWVFAPNGSSKTGHKFESYYPGDAIVDVVGFSAYNFGFCPIEWGAWTTYESIIKPYLDRMRSMAPGKPIFLTQLGTVNRGPNGFDEHLRSEWVLDTLTKLANYPSLRAILYFNVKASHSDLGNCLPKVDFRIFRTEYNDGNNGFADALRSRRFGTWSSTEQIWSKYAFPEKRPVGVFSDVWPSHPFSGQPDVYYFRAVTALKSAGITGGCGVDTDTRLPKYCPNAVVSRDQMAVFLEKSMRGAKFIPTSAISNIFNDVPIDYWAADWIELLNEDQITGGCSIAPPLYCPTSAVTRSQMAVFISKAKRWPTYFKPTMASGTVFRDVAQGHWAADWIEQMARDEITGGCSANPPLFCPESAVTRGQMAVFLVNAFGLKASGEIKNSH